MSIDNNANNTVGITFWRTPRILIIGFGRKQLQINLPLWLRK